MTVFPHFVSLRDTVYLSAPLSVASMAVITQHSFVRGEGEGDINIKVRQNHSIGDNRPLSEWNV